MSSPPEEDIRRTLARYCQLVDDGRFDEWSELFVESGRFHVMQTTHQGRAAIVDFVAAGLTPERRGKHMIANSLIELDSSNGSASVWSDFVFFDRAGAVTTQGRYHDVMERGADKVWRFTLREIVFPGEKPELTDPAPAHTFA